MVKCYKPGHLYFLSEIRLLSTQQTQSMEWMSHYKKHNVRAVEGTSCKDRKGSQDWNADAEMWQLVQDPCAFLSAAFPQPHSLPHISRGLVCSSPYAPNLLHPSSSQEYSSNLPNTSTQIKSNNPYHFLYIEILFCNWTELPWPLLQRNLRKLICKKNFLQNCLFDN